MARFVRLTGLSSYRSVHALQERLVDQRLTGRVPDTVLFVEHPATITVGRRREASVNVLQAGDLPVVSVERGGDVTWHGPGQLVAYPIIALRGDNRDLHAHLSALEEAVIGLLADLGLHGHRDPRNTGVWLTPPGAERLGPVGGGQKVCSVGIACRKWVTWHGLALNVSPEMGGFQRINPCGFDAGVMTRLSDHLNPGPTVGDLAPRLSRHLARALVIPPGPLEESTVDRLS